MSLRTALAQALSNSRPLRLFFQAKAEARSSSDMQAAKPAIILKEGRGPSRPEDQDEDDKGD